MGWITALLVLVVGLLCGIALELAFLLYLVDELKTVCDAEVQRRA